MSKTARVFRLRLGIDYSANASGGDWRLYDDIADLKHDLVAAYVDVLISKEREDRERSRLASYWRKRFRGDDETYPRVSNIFGVEQLIDGEWVGVVPEFTDPAVSLLGVV